MSDALVIPAGCTPNGRSEIMSGRGVLHFTDSVTGSDFVVPEQMATEDTIRTAQLEHRERFLAAGVTFAPVV